MCKANISSTKDLTKFGIILCVIGPGKQPNSPPLFAKNDGQISGLRYLRRPCIAHSNINASVAKARMMTMPFLIVTDGTNTYSEPR
jgi:hypothetical protein